MANITVNSFDDNLTADGQVTLREALDAANTDTSVDGSTAGSGADTIVFDASLAGQTITLSSQLVISSEVIITGLGADQLTISGNNATRIFYVDDDNDSNDANVTIEGLTLTEGNATIDVGGAIRNQENLTITNSTISGNSANTAGGGIYNAETLTITNSTISGNSANTIGGGITNFLGTTEVTNSTISSNSADEGGGIFNFLGTTEVTNSTISSNSADESGGGIINFLGTTTITSTIIAGNTSDDVNSTGDFTSGGNNLIGNGDNGTGFTNGTNGDIVGTTASPIDPKLDPLADNGGTTQTHALQSDSSAINAGSNPNNLTTDQRGEVRVSGASADIGAFEAPLPAITATLTDNLLLDFNFDALLNPGESIRYTAIINNSGDDTSNNTIFQLTPDNNTTLSVGSVTTSAGTVTTGNTGGDTTIAVDIGTVAVSGTVTITFDVVVNNPVSVNQVSTQGTVSGDNFTNVLTDDPDDATSNSDVTVSNVIVIPPTVSITAPTPNATEGGSDGVFTISRDDSSGDLTVNLTINGSSSAVASDYSLNGGSVAVAGNTLTVTIPDGSTSVDVNLSAVADVATEPAETIQLDIAADSNYDIDGFNNSATVTIEASVSPQLVINEIDYDQLGADGDNFIELFNNDSDTINLNGYQILLVNQDGSPYDTINLDNVDLAAGDYYVISNNATNIANTDQEENFTLQNGVDAVALVFGSDIIDTISYEGDTTGYTEGTGTTVADLNDFANVGLSRFPNGADTDDNSADFILQGITPGTVNTVTPTVTLSINPDPANLNDGGSTATITAAIDTYSGQDITVNLAFSSTATEGLDYTVANSITIPAGQLSNDITLTTVEDFVVEGNETILVDIDSVVNGLESGNEQVNATIIDDDIFGITVTPTSGLATTEAGDTTQFTVVLDSQPSDDVVVSLTNDNTTEGTTDVSLLTFTSGNWDTPQTVTVTGVDDFIDDNDVTYTISTTATSSDPNYDSLTGNPVTVINQDDGDTAGITINKTTLTTSEDLTTDEFTVVLDSQPVADVEINFTGDTSEGNFVAGITFTDANWDTPQTVTVTGVDDLMVDGDIIYTLVTDVNTTDTQYSAIAPVDLTVTNLDDDTAAITVTVVDNQTTEAGDTAHFNLVLASQPTGDVVINFTNGDDEGSLDVNTLTFTDTNWNTPQTLTVTGVDDDVEDGDIIYTITTEVNSTDTQYSALNPEDLVVTNLDDDVDITEDDTNTITPSLNYPENNNIFAIEGNPDTEITLEFSLNNEVSASFVNEVGLILVDDINGGIDTNGDGSIDLNPDDDNYAEIALALGQVIFSALPEGLGNNQLSSTIRNLPTGKFISFYLVQNSTTDNFIQSTNNQATPPPVFFSSVVSNEDVFNHLEVTNLNDSDFIIGFEDQINGGDQDFDDLNLRVKTTTESIAVGTSLQISQGLEVFDLSPYDGQFIRGEFTVLPSSDASFNNLVGIYTMADEQGTVVDPVTGNILTPGDINYAQVARNNSVVEFDRNGIDPVLLLGGFSYGTYLVADGVNGGEEMFFPFLDANSDNLDHIRLLGDNILGFEDLVGSGDFSYDDFVYQAEFTLV